MRIAIACDGEALPGDLLELLTAAGLPTAPLITWCAAPGKPWSLVEGEVEWLVAPGRDVLTVCSCGAATAGIVGKDLLAEHEPELCDLVDLGVVRERLVHAAPRASGRASRRRPRVATCYPRTTREHFAARGRGVDALEMSSPSLAVAVGIAGSAVDLERRLAASGQAWEELAEVAVCSARLVAGRQARVLRESELAELIDRLREAQRGA